MNFFKVVRMALRYKWTFAASIVCALTVAVVWGLNIGSLYPVVEIFSKGDSMQVWVEREIAKADASVAEQTRAIAELQEQLDHTPQDAAAERRILGGKIVNAEARVTAETKAGQYYRRLKPYIDDYLPPDPFQTLGAGDLVLLVGTLVKDLFFISNNMLVARLAQLATFDLRKLFYRRTLRMDLATFSDDGTADLMSRFTNDMNQVAGGPGGAVRQAGPRAAEDDRLPGRARLICWRLLLLSLVVAPLAAICVRWLAKMLKRANRRAMEEMAVIYTTLEETFRGIKIVKAFTNERQERKQFHDNSKTLLPRRRCRSPATIRSRIR